MANKQEYSEKDLKSLREKLRKARIPMEKVAKKARVSVNYPTRILTCAIRIENWEVAEKAQRVVKAAETLLEDAA